jgi:UDP-glucose 4-epimerase
MERSCAVLITGGAGYVGSHVAWACCDAGFEVVILDNLSTGVRRNVPERATLIEGDISDSVKIANIIKQYHIEAILHFAGSLILQESFYDPYEYYKNNTVNTLTLARAAVDWQIKAFIFSSTAAVYCPAYNKPLTEYSPKMPLSPYGWSKLMSEQMLADISSAHGISVGILRYFNVVGADAAGRTGQSTANATHLIKVACQVATGKREKLPIFGSDYPTRDGTCIRDYIHVSDLANANVLLLKYLLAGGENVTANCGYGHGISVREVIEALERHTNASLPVVLKPRRAGDTPISIADPSHLKSIIDWEPRFSDISSIVASALAWESSI